MRNKSTRRLLATREILAEHWRSGALWLGWNLMGMLGLWGAACLIFLFHENAPWLELVDRGQFFLYSVGALGQVMYILTKEREITTLPQRSLLTYFSVGCLLLCTLLFSGTVLSSFADNTLIEPRMWILRLLGLATFVASLTMGFAVTIVAEEREEVDFAKLSQQSVSRLETKITDLEDQMP